MGRGNMISYFYTVTVLLVSIDYLLAKPFLDDCKDHDLVDCNAIRGTPICREVWVYEYCPVSCGVCGLEIPGSGGHGCEDKDSECDSIHDTAQESCKDVVVKENCPKTCGVCGKHTHPPHLLKTTPKSLINATTTTPPKVTSVVSSFVSAQASSQAHQTSYSWVILPSSSSDVHVVQSSTGKITTPVAFESNVPDITSDGHLNQQTSLPDLLVTTSVVNTAYVVQSSTSQISIDSRTSTHVVFESNVPDITSDSQPNHQTSLPELFTTSAVNIVPSVSEWELLQTTAMHSNNIKATSSYLQMASMSVDEVTPSVENQVSKSTDQILATVSAAIESSSIQAYPSTSSEKPVLQSTAVILQNSGYEQTHVETAIVTPAIEESTKPSVDNQVSKSTDQILATEVVAIEGSSIQAYPLTSSEKPVLQSTAVIVTPAIDESTTPHQESRRPTQIIEVSRSKAQHLNTDVSELAIALSSTRVVIMESSTQPKIILATQTSEPPVLSSTMVKDPMTVTDNSKLEITTNGESVTDTSQETEEITVEAFTESHQTMEGFSESQTKHTTDHSVTGKPVLVSMTTTKKTSPQQGEGRSCRVCDSPFCELGFENIAKCPDATPYCMNTIRFDASGKKTLNKSCAGSNECQQKWLQETSKIPNCVSYREDQMLSNLLCDFCCVTDGCNIHTVPDVTTIYTYQNIQE